MTTPPEQMTISVSTPLSGIVTVVLENAIWDPPVGGQEVPPSPVPSVMTNTSDPSGITTSTPVEVSFSSETENKMTRLSLSAPEKSADTTSKESSVGVEVGFEAFVVGDAVGNLGFFDVAGLFVGKLLIESTRFLIQKSSSLMVASKW
jgi:hypothetical protein